MPPMQQLKMFDYIVPGIIVDDEVEEEEEESRKRTDRALMMESGLLTAIQVKEYGDCGFIQRLRAR